MIHLSSSTGRDSKLGGHAPSRDLTKGASSEILWIYKLTSIQCDGCQEHNTSVVQRCDRCNLQYCKDCMHKAVDTKNHKYDSAQLDWNVSSAPSTSRGRRVALPQPSGTGTQSGAGKLRLKAAKRKIKVKIPERLMSEAEKYDATKPLKVQEYVVLEDDNDDSLTTKPSGSEAPATKILGENSQVASRVKTHGYDHGDGNSGLFTDSNSSGKKRPNPGSFGADSQAAPKGKIRRYNEYEDEGAPHQMGPSSRYDHPSHFSNDLGAITSSFKRPRYTSPYVNGNGNGHGMATTSAAQHQTSTPDHTSTHNARLSRYSGPGSSSPQAPPRPSAPALFEVAHPGHFCDAANLRRTASTLSAASTFGNAMTAVTHSKAALEALGAQRAAFAKECNAAWNEEPQLLELKAKGDIDEAKELWMAAAQVRLPQSQSQS
ncbi:uncharacterized protein L3040_009018 [Drepanopeziza brunnea f. sp. 'multigermtubi']|uniref:uncharacterized protein n=1 Tax=Drepanopeziza brunnea f. sp. 'multigermtubi' TaxID=698441 RepID=UPI0023A586CE|nr:hypothetical protein L3040_009018 [Drepanopeziza brunnea f. sp. 'multigermtubi']